MRDRELSGRRHSVLSVSTVTPGNGILGWEEEEEVVVVVDCDVCEEGGIWDEKLIGAGAEMETEGGAGRGGGSGGGSGGILRVESTAWVAVVLLMVGGRVLSVRVTV